MALPKKKLTSLPARSAKNNHPNAVQIYDVLSAEDVDSIVMEH